jgi:hypothetical protein
MIRTIAVCEAQVPFVHGGAELHVRGPVDQLRHRHASKITWLFHQYRAIYDLCGTAYSEFTHTEADVRLRAKLIELDRGALGESVAIFSNARNTAARLAHDNGLEAEPLYHPPPLAGRLKSGTAGNYFLSVGRLETVKRVDLIIRTLHERARTISWDGVIERLIEAGSR